MSTVIDLAAHRRARGPGCACRDGWTCYPHRVADAADLIRRDLDDHAGALLLPASALADALTRLDAITAETLPHEHPHRDAR